MSSTPLKHKRKNDDWYEWADGELPPPPVNWLVQLFSWSWRVIKSPFRWAWQGAINVLRWSWRFTIQATMWSLRVTWAATVWATTAPFRGLRWLFGSAEPTPQNRFEEIRQRIRRHYRRRNRFITHLFLFTIANVVMWMNILVTDYYDYGSAAQRQQAIGIAVFWAVLLLYHFIRVRMGDAEDQALEAALERERDWEYKPRFADEPSIETYGARLNEETTWADWETPQPPQEKRKTTRSR